MRNTRSLILILLILLALLAACAPETSAPAGARAVASLVVATEPETDVSSGQDDQPTPAPSASETPPPVARGRVNVQGLNLRAGPGANHVVLGLLSEGTELEIEGRSENLQWLQVRVSGGTQGWVYREYVDTETVIASLPLKEAYGGPQASPSNAGQDVRLPLNVQVSIENNLGVVYISGFPGDSKVIARLGEAGETADLYVGESVTTENGNAVIRFPMPSLEGNQMNLIVSTASGDESVNVRIQYFRD